MTRSMIKILCDVEAEPIPLSAFLSLPGHTASAQDVHMSTARVSAGLMVPVTDATGRPAAYCAVTKAVTATVRAGPTAQLPGTVPCLGPAGSGQMPSPA